MKGKSNSLITASICGAILSTTLAFTSPNIVLSQADTPRSTAIILDTTVEIPTPPIVERLAEKTKVLNAGVKSMNENSRANEKKVDKLGRVVQQLKNTLATDDIPTIQPGPKFQTIDSGDRDGSTEPTQPPRQRKTLIERVKGWLHWK